MAEQRVRGLRGILFFVVAFVVVLGTATWAAAQCAYPALELLEFDYVNSPQMIHKGTDGHAKGKVCVTAPIRKADNKEESFSRLQYEYEGRLLVLHTLLRWLNLDAAAEAWTPLPQ
ncbi:MAG: hypothetical protein O6929_01570 [candidate division NC10 bacterium]|jgi:hypothetical protein|nr:hypothetical protein [candidate division NC10 bacterium]